MHQLSGGQLDVTMRIKVKGGTAKSGNLCEGCDSYSRVDFQDGESAHLCNAGNIGGIYRPLRLTAPVADCTEFQPKGHVSLWDLKEKAWIIEVTKGRKIGFHTPKEWREAGKDIDVNVEEL